MKTHKFTAIVAIMLMGLFMASCDEETDIIVIDGNIPIKTSTLSIVGDATPALWAVNNSYPLEMSEEYNLEFIYGGMLTQEGHTAHATREEAEAEAQKMLHVYGDFAENYMAVPVIKGVKSVNERFSGALDT